MNKPHTGRNLVRLCCALFVGGCICANAMAQKPIKKVEYFLDSDPGYGQAVNVPVTAGTNLDVKFDVNTAGLSEGVHLLCIRGFNGVFWSHTYTHVFVTPRRETTVSAVEYYFDQDPGQGKATLIAGQQVSGNVSLDFDAVCSSLTPGIHTLGIRARDDKGVWSHTYTCIVAIKASSAPSISAIEYYFDTDPGIGKAIPYAVSSEGGYAVVSLDAVCDTVSAGIHTLGIRACSNGVWSHTYTHAFIVKGKDAEVSYAEYYWDNDPGKGKGCELPFTRQKDYVLVNVDSIPTDTLSAGLHTLMLRACANGVWSQTTMRKISVNGTPDFIFSKDTICVGEELKLTNESVDTAPATTYEWDMNDDGKAESTDPVKFAYAYNNAGTYKVTLKAKLGTNCITTRVKEIVVLPIENPKVVLKGNALICPGSEVVFVASGQFGGDAPRYEWFKNNKPVSFDTDSVLFAGLQKGDKIKVRMISSNPCCNIPDVTSETVTIDEKEIAEGSLAPYFPVYTSEPTFTMSGGKPEGGVYYVDEIETQLLNPALYGAGKHKINYRYPSESGCTGEVTSYFDVRMPGASSLLMGDVNKDERVDVYDVLCTVDHIYGVKYPTFSLLTADVSGGGRVDVSDVVGIASIILQSRANAVRQKSDRTKAYDEHTLALNDLWAMPGTTARAVVTISGNAWISGVQFDVTLPKGVKAVSVSPSVRVGRNADTKTNTYTVLAYTMSLDNLCGELPLGLEIDGNVPEGVYPVSVSSAILSDTDMKNVATRTVEGKLTISRSESAIIAARSGIFVTSADKEINVKGAEGYDYCLYDVSGRMIETGKSMKAFEVLSAEIPGTYLLRITKGHSNYEFKVSIK